MNLAEELKNFLLDQGADLVGIGDMRAVKDCGYTAGVSVAAALPPNVVLDLQTAPTKEYYDLYYSLNDRLNKIVLAGESFLVNRGYDAYAQTTGRVEIDAHRMSRIPHKTVATRAGLGWIGKNCLLVTPFYGSAVRISSLLTNAPLECDEPIDRSRCGQCRLCVENCPARSLKGTLWEAGVRREEIVDVDQCYRTQVDIMTKHTGIKTDLCGKCFAVCAYTRQYLNRVRG